MQYAVVNVSNRLSIGPFLDFNDLSPLESLVSQNGTFQSLTNTSTVLGPVTPSAWGAGTGGHYVAVLAGSVFSQVGRLRIEFNSQGIYIPVWEDYMVMTQEAYDSYLSYGAGGTDETQFLMEVSRS